jgi:hypothetical protein
MSKKPPTKAEREHMSRVAELGCIACRKLGFHDSLAEIHHIRSGMGMGQRNSHFKVIPLCPHHHRHGPDAIHVSPAAFQRKFGHEEDLLKQVYELLGGNYENS